MTVEAEHVKEEQQSASAKGDRTVTHKKYVERDIRKTR
jgi:tRNA nucleotidyltransferase (CCA-adding enzyme)